MRRAAKSPSKSVTKTSEKSENAPIERFIYEFGPFRLDAGERRLIRKGKPIVLSAKLFDTLLALVENRGHLLTKDELLERVWPDTFVEEGNLAKNISVLRKQLGEGEDGRHYIETVPKLGYRFLADVTEVVVNGRGIEAEEASIAQTLDNRGKTARSGLAAIALTHQRVTRWLLTAGVFLGALSWGTIWFHSSRTAEDRSGVPNKSVPFSSFAGTETNPSFSPDGTQIAFAWDKDTGVNFDIYVKPIGVETPLQLTSNPAIDDFPSWSPAGGTIAFYRHSQEATQVYAIAATGGPEQKLSESAGGPFEHFSRGFARLSWSPDGKMLALTERTEPTATPGILLLNIETRQKRKLAEAPPLAFGDFLAAFSPDGNTVAFVRMSTLHINDVYIVSSSGGSDPKRLTSIGRMILGLTWEADGQYLVFSTFPESRLMRVPATGGIPEDLGFSGSAPTISRSGRMAYVARFEDTNLWQIGINGSKARGDPTRLIGSSQGESRPQFSPDGKRIVFVSMRSGSRQIWLSNSDGTGEIPLTPSGANATAPSWSPDNRRIAYQDISGGHDVLFTLDIESSFRRQVSSATYDIHSPRWSHDGQWLYFGSKRGGDWQIWKMLAEGGEPVQVTTRGGREASESTDGRFLYYSKNEEPGLWRIPIEGGAEELVVDALKPPYIRRYWTVNNTGIYFLNAMNESNPAIEFKRFDTGQTTRIVSIKPSVWYQGLTVSPDGRWLVYSQLDHSGSDIMLIENFH